MLPRAHRVWPLDSLLHKARFLNSQMDKHFRDHPRWLQSIGGQRRVDRREPVLLVRGDDERRLSADRRYELQLHGEVEQRGGRCMTASRAG